MATERPSQPSSPAPGRAARHPSERLIWVALVATLGLAVGAGLTASNWLWGVNTLHHWPPGGAVLLAALGLLGFVGPARHSIAPALDRIGSRWDRAGLAGDLKAMAPVVLVLLVLRDPLRFTGDSLTRAGWVSETLSASELTLAYPLDVWVNARVARALAHAGLGPMTALQVVGALMGGCFALVGFRFLRAAGARRGLLPAGAIALLGGSTLAHFAGYDKFGPLMVGLALAATGAVHMAARGRGTWTLVMGVVVTVLSHRSGFLLLPAAAWLLSRAYRAGDARARRRILLGSLVVALAVLPVFGRTVDTYLHYDRVVHLPGGTVAESRLDRPIVANLVHRVADGLNALFFLVPLWLVGAAARVMLRARGDSASAARRHSRLGLAAGLALAGFAVVLFGVEPGGGWARDWDVATGASTLVAMVSTYALVGAWRRGTDTLAPAVTVALSMTVAAWGIHSSERIGLARVAALLEARPALSDPIRAGICDFRGVRALNGRRFDEAAPWFERSIQVGGPNPRVVYEAGLAYFRGGKLAAARAAFTRAASLSRSLSTPYVWLTRIALADRDTATAIAMLDSSLARHPASVEIRRWERALRAARAP